ncbi:MAG: HAMP domain-containing sensor histidine kinase [Acidobacteriota bacterium]
MAHTIAHEINNPLAAITNLLYLLRDSVDDSEVGTSYLAAAEQEVDRVSRISRQILSFHRESATRVQVNLSDLLEDVLALNNRELIDRNLRVTRRWDAEAVVCGFPAQLRQVFSNILRNAVEASHKGSEIVVKISNVMIEKEKRERGVRVTVCDRGHGILRENRHKIFDAFFTTKELKGTGVGLWLSSNIVHEHRGRIQLRSSTRPQHSGTCLSVILPRNVAEAE